VDLEKRIFFYFHIGGAASLISLACSTSNRTEHTHQNPEILEIWKHLSILQELFFKWSLMLYQSTLSIQNL
jgi:hypothetical protein